MTAGEDSLEHLIDALADVARRHRTLTVRLARDSGLAASHVAVLAALARLGEVRLQGLAEELFVDPSVISRHVGALEQEGCITRRQDPADARAALIRLSDRGSESLRQVRALRRRHLEAALADWEVGDVVGLTEVLGTVGRLLDPTQPGAQPAAAPDAATDAATNDAPASEVVG